MRKLLSVFRQMLSNLSPILPSSLLLLCDSHNYYDVSASIPKCRPKDNIATDVDSWILVWSDAMIKVFLELLEEAHNSGKRSDTGFKPEARPRMIPDELTQLHEVGWIY